MNMAEKYQFCTLIIRNSLGASYPALADTFFSWCTSSEAMLRLCALLCAHSCSLFLSFLQGSWSGFRATGCISLKHIIISLTKLHLVYFSSSSRDKESQWYLSKEFHYDGKRAAFLVTDLNKWNISSSATVSANDL